MSKIPDYILCKNPEEARQVLEKIERESDLRWSGDNEKPSEYIPKSFYPNLVIFTKNILRYGSSRQCELDGITNFTKAEDYLLSDETKIRLEELDNKLDKLINDMTNKTWETLSVGDILIDSNDLEVAVLAVIGRIIFISEPDNYDESNCYYTSKELIEMGYKIKGASEQKPGLDRAIELLEWTINPHNTYYQDRGTVEEAIEMLKKLK